MTELGIKYKRPKVFLLANTGIGNAEFAARTCYDSFDKSENDDIIRLNELSCVDDVESMVFTSALRGVEALEDSDLLKQLSFVHFHHSVLEHNVLTFLIKGTSRGVLQELARHRIASYSVRSTRYTLDDLLYIFIASHLVFNDLGSKNLFIGEALELDLLVTETKEYNSIELGGIYDKLLHQYILVGKEEFVRAICPKETAEKLLADGFDNYEEALDEMRLKKKRNAGDKFKHIITDNFKVDLIWTINLRSLRNFLELRDSGAAWFQIRWLAEEVKNVMPASSKKLIFKNYEG
jgi:thymidylate synthase (FAD)